MTGLLACCLHACSSEALQEPAATKAEATVADLALTRTVVVDGLRDPWDLGFLPDGTLLITEREGQIVMRRPSGERLVLLDTPAFLYDDHFQAGLQGLAIDPEVASNRYIYTFLTRRLEGAGNLRTIAAATVTAGSVTITADAPVFSATDVGRAVAAESGALVPGTNIKTFISPTQVSATLPAKGTGRTRLRVQRVENAVVRWTLAPDQAAVTFDRTIVDGLPYGYTDLGHHGGRIRFGPDGYLYVAVGDGDVLSFPQSGRALGGKILRVDRNGLAAATNHAPAGFDPRILTYGHRNPQGLAFRPSDGQPFSVEHGDSQDDEVNRLIPGSNYGWDPTVDRLRMTNLERYPQAVRAVWSSGPTTVAPSGALFLLNRGGVDWKGWRNALVIATLKSRRLLVISIGDAGTVTHVSEALTDGGARLRSLIQGPDGALYLSTDRLDDPYDNTPPPGRPAAEVWRITPK